MTPIDSGMDFFESIVAEEIMTPIDSGCLREGCSSDSEKITMAMKRSRIDSPTTTSMSDDDDDEYDCPLKILLVGDSSVGKKSLRLRFVDDSYVDSSITKTVSPHALRLVGASKKTKTVKLDGKTIKLEITLPSRFYRDGDGIMIVYDITKMESFNNVKKWLNEIAKNASSNVCKMLVGNKCDLVHNKVVDTKTAKAFADELRIPFLETSAKDSTNVEQAFLTMAREIMKNWKGGPSERDSPILPVPPPRRLSPPRSLSPPSSCSSL